MHDWPRPFATSEETRSIPLLPSSFPNEALALFGEDETYRHLFFQSLGQSLEKGVELLLLFTAGVISSRGKPFETHNSRPFDPLFEVSNAHASQNKMLAEIARNCKTFFRILQNKSAGAAQQVVQRRTSRGKFPSFSTSLTKRQGSTSDRQAAAATLRAEQGWQSSG